MSSSNLAATVLIAGAILAAPPAGSGQPDPDWVARILGSHNGVGLPDEFGRVPSHALLTGTLRSGETAEVRVHTCADIEYVAAGVCDHGCRDFDLIARDGTGEVLDSDVLADDFPVVIFTPATCGFTTLSVEMVSCEDACAWGVQLYMEPSSEEEIQ